MATQVNKIVLRQGATFNDVQRITQILERSGTFLGSDTINDQYVIYTSMSIDEMKKYGGVLPYG